MLQIKRQQLLEQLQSHAVGQLSIEASKSFALFSTQYCANVELEDLYSKPLAALYKNIFKHWQFILAYPSIATDPRVQLHNTQNQYCIIEIVQPDIPFIVDSIKMLLHRLQIKVHFLTYSNYAGMLALYIEIAQLHDEAALSKIRTNIINLCLEVRYVVTDWSAMCARLQQNIVAVSDVETREFLQWLVDDNFTFLGYSEYKIETTANDLEFSKVVDHSLGISPEGAVITTMELSSLYADPQVLFLGKTGVASKIHRPADIDFVALKILDAAGNLVGVARFIGLYTSDAYNSSLKVIPILRDKCSAVLKLSSVPEKSHAAKELVNILETLPRENLFYLNAQELYELAIGILRLQERNVVRVFINKESNAKFFSCLVFVPRERFSSELRFKIQKILLQELHGLELTFTTRFSESTLARIHFIIKNSNVERLTYDVNSIEEKIIAVARNWYDDLQIALQHNNDLWQYYNNTFSVSYKDKFSAQAAAIDIQYLEKIVHGVALEMYIYVPENAEVNTIHFKLFHKATPITLARIIPILENMGLETISERPYKITTATGKIYLNDYKIRHSYSQQIDLNFLQQHLKEAFLGVYNGLITNDPFNKLILYANMNWREVNILRAYSRYLYQIGFAYGQRVIVQSLFENIDVTKDLLKLFQLRFDPQQQKNAHAMHQLSEQLVTALDLISNITFDKVLRQIMHLILATMRTNYYQYKEYLVYKLDSLNIPNLPLPKPAIETFVFHINVEGIHLRAARVARGGIRWSDREDFRTEILSLMKAQQVKNASIVPMGAKGGFIIKNDADPVACYKLFISGLLDITDNKIDANIVAPSNVVCYDEVDPYLVVAADKGTASFSDIANEISLQYNFWLQDAFASGGKNGYDHKRIGITAKGAWEAVQLHFAALKHDMKLTSFTVVGIGDMAGDVFGNGMLLSKNIKLVAAFNHKHIFIDPNPDVLISYQERQRLFHTPGIGWQDYAVDKISSGGGIFARDVKKIELTAEIKQLLNVANDYLSPNELIINILQAEVDLLWNGGIGTFIKSSKESNAEVHDRSNDAIRINATELGCKIVGEGGNLGFTQLARVEFATCGGLINTDFIDNSAGVTCSDFEVNLKILLQQVIDDNGMTLSQRNILLLDLETQVSAMVLTVNKVQCMAITNATLFAAKNIDMYGRVLNSLVREGHLDLVIEFLPNKTEIATRKSDGLGLTRPEVSVLMAYIKNIINKELLQSNMLMDPYMQQYLISAFPSVIADKFATYLLQHPLATEIIATKISSMIVDEMGISFIYRLQDETGSSKVAIIGAYLVAREICRYSIIAKQIADLGMQISYSAKLQMQEELNRLVRRFSRWLLRNRRDNANITAKIHYFTAKVAKLYSIVPNLLQGSSKKDMQQTMDGLLKQDIPETLAARIAVMPAMFSALDIIAAASSTAQDLETVARCYYAIGDKLDLFWFRQQIKKHKVSNNWEALARAAFRDDLDRQQHNITIALLRNAGSADFIAEDVHTWLDPWLTNNIILIQRWQQVIAELKTSVTSEFTMFAVALRELFELSQHNH